MLFQRQAGAAAAHRRPDLLHQAPLGLPPTCAVPAPPCAMLQPQTDEARDEYWRNHLEPEAARGSCKGAHMLYVQNFVQKHGKVGGRAALMGGPVGPVGGGLQAGGCWHMGP